MKKPMRPSRWVISFIAALLVLIMLLMLAAYLIDPFFQFRVRDNIYELSPRFCSPGLIRNADYDTIIIGSSVTQNFDMDWFRNALGGNPLHIGVGGMNTAEELEYIHLAEEVGKADRYYICVDLDSFTEEAPSKTPKYLLEEGFLNKCRYLVGYETWFRFIPVDIAYMGLKAAGVPFDEKLRYKTDIDFLGYWGHKVKFGEEYVLQEYSDWDSYNSEADAYWLRRRMEKNIDRYFVSLPWDLSGYTFFFPPYSVMYWARAKQGNYYDAYLDAMRVFVREAQRRHADVYDFQGQDLIRDLDFYKDGVHYEPMINNLMLDWIAEGWGKVDPNDRNGYLDYERILLDHQLEEFFKVHPEFRVD